MTPLDFAKPAQRINWTKRVAAFLADLPADGFTPAQDWQIVEALAVGKPVPNLPGWKARALRLMDACRDPRGILSLDGREALIAAVKRKAIS